MSKHKTAKQLADELMQNPDAYVYGFREGQGVTLILFEDPNEVIGEVDVPDPSDYWETVGNGPNLSPGEVAESLNPALRKSLQRIED